VKVVKGLPVEWGMCSRTVLLDSFTQTLSYWNNTVAVGSEPGDIIILDAITGSQIAVLSGHTREVNCLTFSSDGTSLVSGSDDHTVKLWDVQTGGVVKTFSGHTGSVWSVSISADCTTIASGSGDHTINLWNIQTGECYHTIQQQDIVDHVSFFPTNPQHLISICCNKLWQWDTNGHQIKHPFDGFCTAFSSDGTQFVLCNGATVTVQNSDSGAVVARFQVAGNDIQCCCFSPDSRLVAVAAYSTVYVWDITGSNPHLVETFIGILGISPPLYFPPPPSSSQHLGTNQSSSGRLVPYQQIQL
jgi:WD40 repeat protein